ncbi:MAG: type II and III secretion system protein family protein [Gemmatimonadota bacterium]
MTTLARLGLAAFCAAWALSSASTCPAEVLRLRPGFQQILDFPEVTRISVGNPEVVEARPLTKKDGVLVVGKKEGDTDLVVWEKDRRTDLTIEVRNLKPPYAEEARVFAGTYRDLTITDTGSSVMISGTVPSARDRAVLERFAEGRPGVHLSISLPGERKILLSYDLKIIEIGAGASSQLGIRWPDSVGVRTGFASAPDTGAVFSLEGDFEARLNVLLANGRARILANPKLVCETGESASFLAGGEIPIVIATPETRTVEWKTYGIILKLEPKMEVGDRIGTRITAEISTVDHASGSSDVPGFMTRRVTTVFSTAAAETVMLSGLVKSEMAKDVAKLPLLGQIPILGELFKSRTFRENRSELAIFITPREITGGSAGELAEWDERARKEKEAMRLRFLD